MPTLPLNQRGRTAQTHSTELIRDPFSGPYAIDRRGGLLAANLERSAKPLSPSHAVDVLAATLVGDAAAHSIGWTSTLPSIGAHLEFSTLVAGVVEALGANWRPSVEDLWEGLIRPSFKPMYGRATRADRTLVSKSTSGRIRSREVQPEYEED
jgi:hypothetical protein